MSGNGNRWSMSDVSERISQTRALMARTLEAITAQVAQHVQVPAAIWEDGDGALRIGEIGSSQGTGLSWYKRRASKDDDARITRIFGTTLSAGEVDYLYSVGCEALRLLGFLDPSGSGMLLVHPAQGEQALHRFTVIYTTVGDDTWQFFNTHAADSEHAEEQAKEQEPGVHVLWVNTGLYNCVQE